MNDSSHKSSKDAEAEIWNAIATFEKILEVMPADRVSLETLADAYEKMGDHTRSVQYAARLVGVLLDESEEDEARELLNKLLTIAPDDPQVQEAGERLKAHKPDKVMADVMVSSPDIRVNIAFLRTPSSESATVPEILSEVI